MHELDKIICQMHKCKFSFLICRRRWQLKQILLQDCIVGPGTHPYPWSALLILCASEHETSSRSASGAPFRPFQVLKTLPKWCWSWNLSQNQPTNKHSTLWPLFMELILASKASLYPSVVTVRSYLNLCCEFYLLINSLIWYLKPFTSDRLGN